MRRFMMIVGLISVGSSAIAAPPLKRMPSLAVAKKAITSAGPQATDAEVSAAYPGFMLHPDHAPAPWFVASTEDGCLFYAYDVSFDPPAKWPKNVAEWMRDRFHVKWTGTPCVPGQPISGQGTLSWGDTNIRNTGYRDDDYDSYTGTMHKGVFTGMVQRDYSYDEAKTRTITKKTLEKFGGCSLLDPKMVNPALSMCQPRLP